MSTGAARYPAVAGAAVALAAAALAAACGGAGDAGEAWVTLDSAGIAVTTTDLSMVPPLPWRVAEQPALAVGGLAAPDEAQLFRVTAAKRLEDGRLVVSSAGSHDVRVFGADGAVVAVIGQEGRGPGEFDAPVIVGVVGDTIVVFDSGLERISLLHPDEGFVGSRAVQWTGKGFALPRGMLSDGSVAFGGGMSFSSREGFPTGVIRPSSTWGWVRRDGTEVHVAELPAAEMFARADERGFMARGLPFGRFTVAAVDGSGMWIGDSGSPVLRHYAAGGSVDRIVRWTGETPPAVTPDLLETWIRENVDEDAAGEERRRELRALVAEMPVPETAPYYQAALVDRDGNLWIEDHLLPGDDTPSWLVADPSGRILGRLFTPPRTRLLEIGTDYLLGVTLDDFDVETLTLWALTR